MDAITRSGGPAGSYCASGSTISAMPPHHAHGAHSPKQHDLGVFSAGFVLGALGMYIAAWLYGYRRVQ
jgi:hypothetical protein